MDKRINTLKTVLLFSLVVSLMLSPALGACKKTISVSAAENWPPYSYREGRTFKGLDIDIVELVLAKAGLCWKYISFPSSSRSLLELKKKKVDLIFAASHTDLRDDFADFSVPYRQERMQLFSHIDNKALPQLKPKKTVAVNRGSTYGVLFDRFRNTCAECVVETNLAIERFRLVKKKRTDYAIEDSLTGKYIIAKKGLAPYVQPTSLIVHNSPIYFMLRTQLLNKTELEILNTAIIESEAEIQTSIANYHTFLAKYGETLQQNN